MPGKSLMCSLRGASVIGWLFNSVQHFGGESLLSVFISPREPKARNDRSGREVLVVCNRYWRLCTRRCFVPNCSLFYLRKLEGTDGSFLCFLIFFAWTFFSFALFPTEAGVLEPRLAGGHACHSRIDHHDNLEMVGGSSLGSNYTRYRRAVLEAGSTQLNARTSGQGRQDPLTPRAE
jgi:hypothetical protein